MAGVIPGRATSGRHERESTGGGSALGLSAKLAAGVAVAALLWVALEWSQRSWLDVDPTGSGDERMWNVGMLVLAGSVLFAAARWASAVTLGVATAVLAVPVVPAALGGDVLWPSFLPGEPLITATNQASFVVIGVLGAASVSKAALAQSRD